MANLAIGTVKSTQGMGVSAPVKFGEAGSAGQAVYLRRTDSMHWLASSATPESAAIAGILMNDVGIGGWAVIQTTGNIDLGTVSVQGTPIVLSATPGALAPAADLAPGAIVTTVGVMGTTSILNTAFNSSGIAHG